jgi:hypothetical protein
MVELVKAPSRNLRSLVERLGRLDSQLATYWPDQYVNHGRNLSLSGMTVAKMTPVSSDKYHKWL